MSHLYHKFDQEYEIELEAIGDGVVNVDDYKSSLDGIYAAFQEKHSRMPADISLSLRNAMTCAFTAIDPAFLEHISALKELILPDSITSVSVTEKLLSIFRKNNTLIRGSFGSFAEEFAENFGLHFRPADYLFARIVFEPAHETTDYTVIFRRNGSVAIEMCVSSSGSSGGNTFGGTFYHELPQEFWKTMTLEELCSGHPEGIIKDGRLAKFMEMARVRDNMFTGEN